MALTSQVCFNVRWAGSNKDIASNLLIIRDSNNIHGSAVMLQRQVAALVNVESHCIKITLGSAAGPQLTYPLKLMDCHASEKARKAMVLAWSSLNPASTANVFVTQHSPVAVAVSQTVMDCIYDTDFAKYHYARLPQELQRNPAVALVALVMAPGFGAVMHADLRSNKKFALAAIRHVRMPSLIYSNFNKALLEDEEVVCEMRRMWGEARSQSAGERTAVPAFPLANASVSCLRDMLKHEHKLLLESSVV